MERASENRQRRPTRVAVETEHLPVERHEFGRRLILRAGNRIRSASRQLLQDVALESCGRNRNRRNDRKRKAHPIAIEKEEQFVLSDGPTHAAAKMVQRG